MWQRIRGWLTNSWMNEVNFLAAMAHVGWACLLTLACSIWFGSRGQLGASASLIVYAAIKEWGYDAHFELPPQTWRDNLQDFCGYLGGIALAALILWF